MEGLVVILCGVRSIHNVGSIFRTADGAGVSKIYLVGVTPTPLDRLGNFRKDFTKVALGAEKTVEWEKVGSVSVLITKLKREGFLVVAVEQDKRSIPYYSYKLKPRRFGRGKNQSIALVFGEETRGLLKSVLDKCDQILEIPMRGKKESLNVSVSVGIVIYWILFS